MRLVGLTKKSSTPLSRAAESERGIPEEKVDLKLAVPTVAVLGQDAVQFVAIHLAVVATEPFVMAL